MHDNDQNRIEVLESQVRMLMDGMKAKKSQQITAPLDPNSTRIIQDNLPVFQSSNGAFVTVKINGKNYQLSTGQSFAVGAIYSETTGTNPATTLGYGTWAAFGAGQVMVGYKAGDSDFGTVLATGGEKTHALSLGEMPAHTHMVPYGGNGSGGPTAAAANTTSGNITTTSAGSGTAHNNLQPFIVVFLWQRTA